MHYAIFGTEHPALHLALANTLVFAVVDAL